MTAKGHQLLAGAISIPILDYLYSNNILSIESLIIAGTGIYIGSLFPDIDEPNSYIGRKMQVLSFILHLFIKHRGITHSFLFVLIFGLIGLSFTPYPYISYFFFGFSWGILMHDVGDMLTKGGINDFFYPIYDGKIALLPRKFRFYTNSIIEVVFNMLLFLIIIAEIYFYVFYNL